MVCGAPLDVIFEDSVGSNPNAPWNEIPKCPALTKVNFLLTCI